MLLGLVTACAIAGAAIVIHQRVTAYRGGAALTFGTPETSGGTTYVIDGTGRGDNSNSSSNTGTMVFPNGTSGHVTCEKTSPCFIGTVPPGGSVEVVIGVGGGVGGGSGGDAGGKTAPGTVITTYPDHEKTP